MSIIVSMWWHDEEELLTEEEPSKHKRDIGLIKRLFPFFKPYIGKILIAALLLLLSTLLTLVGPLLVKHAIDYTLPAKNLHGLLVIALCYLLIQIVVVFVRYFQQLQIAIIGERAITDLKNKIFDHIIRLPVAFFDKNPTGKLITRVEGDAETLKNLFSSTAVVLVQNFALLVGMSVIMLIASARLYLLIAVMLPIFLYAFWWFGRNVRPVYIDLRRKIAQINGFVMECIRSLGVIQVFVQEDNFVKKINKMGKEKFDLEMHSMSYWYRVWFLVELGEIIGILLVLGIGGTWALKGTMTIGTIFLFISYITRLFEPLRGLSEQINLIERAFASSERIFGILGMKTELSDKETYQLETINKEIQFRDVNFAYEENEWVLKDINFTIKKGEKIALVGETGGGKTSIISLLLKFYEPQSGRILIDNNEINSINRYSLRSRISHVPQDVVLFPGTVLDNLRLFSNEVPPERVFESSKRARIHDLISSLPAGYHTNLIEQGINLSFGERQLISFARALVFDPQLVILDEATSSVDPQSERLIQEGMKELLKDRTAIIIAHRLTTTRLADRIIVIHKGRIVEQGTHSELISRKGFYYSLYRLQYLERAK